MSRVAPLLHRISRRSRVLVLTESRMKPFAVKWNHQRAAIYSDGNLEWAERLFFHYLREAEGDDISSNRRRRTGGKEQKKEDWMKADSAGLWWWDSLQPPSLAVRAMCAQLYHQNLTSTLRYEELGCLDLNHDCPATQKVAVNMMLNLVCNKALNLQDKSTCCI